MLWMPMLSNLVPRRSSSRKARIFPIPFKRASESGAPAEMETAEFWETVNTRQAGETGEADERGGWGIGTLNMQRFQAGIVPNDLF